MPRILIFNDDEVFAYSLRSIFLNEINLEIEVRTIYEFNKIEINNSDIVIANLHYHYNTTKSIFKNFRRLNPQTLVIIITFSSTIKLEQIVKGFLFHNYHIISMPINPSHLKTLILNYLSKYKAGKQCKTENKSTRGNNHTKLRRKKRIFDILKQIEDEPNKWTLGMFSKKFGVSRTQIFKDITELKEINYNIIRTKNGLTLLKS